MVLINIRKLLPKIVRFHITSYHHDSKMFCVFIMLNLKFSEVTKSEVVKISQHYALCILNAYNTSTHSFILQIKKLYLFQNNRSSFIIPFIFADCNMKKVIDCDRMIAPYMGSLLTVVVPNSTHLTTACPWVDVASIFDSTLLYFDSYM